MVALLVGAVIVGPAVGGEVAVKNPDAE